MSELSTLDALDPAVAVERYAPVISRIARAKRIRRRSAEQRFVEMLKFLDVCAQAGATVSPPPRVDDAWHAFILFTREYAAYCEERFGRFIHHDPMESSDAEAYELAYAEAQARFGDLDRRVWPRPHCGVSSGGGWFGCGGGGCGGGGCGGGG